MKAIVYTQYGSPDVLHLSDVEKPTPKDNEVLIRVRTASVGFGDLMARNMRSVSPRKFTMPSLFWLLARISFGFWRPKRQILGAELAGEIEAVGKDVTRFKPGDKVIAYPAETFGGYAEYRTMKETGMVAPMPANMSFEDAVTVPYGAMTAKNLLQKAHIQPGQKVLINGASGSIGSYALQLAKHYGAEVTGVCGTPRMDFVKSLGADHVIDYKRTDFTQNGETYDVILDVLGKTRFGKVKGSLTPTGRIIYASFKMKQVFQMIWTSRFGKKRVVCALAICNQDDMAKVKDMAESGTITTQVDRCFPLEQAAEAHRYIESGQKRGHVIIGVA